jgi:hypothetical protein
VLVNSVKLPALDFVRNVVVGAKLAVLLVLLV